MKLQLVVFIFFLILFGCMDTAKHDNKEEQEKVKALFTNWVKDVSETESADAYFKYVTDDFMLMEAGAPLEVDREKMKVAITGLFADYTFRVENWQSQEVIVRDDIAIHRYSATVVLTSKTDTSRQEINLKYLDILKRDETNEWRVYIHSNSPNK